MPVNISKRERNTILYRILNDGVITMDTNTHKKHHYLQSDNLKVWMIARKLASQGFLKAHYNWKHRYYVLNNKGVNFIKEQLGIKDANVQPETRQKTKKYLNTKTEN